ncbi:lpdA [Symbiodinium natans]|uniref:LpdA protein n=1 Tax=Symbiodinium natans TaxID=878477 RepID=A0A812LPD3_9DINO|nr:lpdA [Symbiodinium natans]
MSLERAGVKCTKDGISVDAKLRTSAKHIYAVGDCLGGLQFTHLAGYQGALAAFNAVQPVSLAGPGNAAVPRCTFTHPEVATVGLTMKEAADAYGMDKVSAKMRMLSHVDRAVCEGETEGFIKIVVDSGGKILGATVVAPAAGDVAQELGLAVAQRLTLRAISTCIHSYPAMSFALQQMAADHVYNSLEKSSALSCLRCLCGPRLHGNSRPSSSEESFSQ